MFKVDDRPTLLENTTMVSRLTDCDPNRLRRLLEDRLDDLDQTAMGDHLETCAECRRTLDAMAAGSRWWSEARMFLSPAPTRDFGETSSTRKTDIEPGLLDFLTPSDDPAHLGRLGLYEVVEVIGRGGMGLVLRAIDPALNRHVAIKVLAPELATSAMARRRFAREGQAAAAISHDHIVAIHSVDGSGGLPYLVMQLVTGKSLQERIDQTGPPTIEEILRIGMQTASGLAAAHAVGLIHRDIKPSNILLENCVERVKITDFGLARAVDDASLTQSGVVAGTPQYMSPEQARGEAADHRADLFSLGSVLYALCTGRPPFRADTTMAVLRRVSDDTPRPIRELNADIPAWLAAIVTKLHAKDPADRYQSATEVAELLGQCLAHLREPTLVPSPFPIEPTAVIPKRKPRRRLAIAAGLAALALCALGAAEATGVTKLVATVLRFHMGDSTIVVKLSDPKVKIKLDGKDLVITGAGPEEIRVNAGVHRVQGIKDGKVISEKIVSIARGGEETVEVSVEATAPAVAAATDQDRQNQGEVALAKSDLTRSVDRLAWSAKMFAKGYVSPAAVESDYLSFKRSQFAATNAAEQALAKSNGPDSIYREIEGLKQRITVLQARIDQSVQIEQTPFLTDDSVAQRRTLQRLNPQFSVSGPEDHSSDKLRAEITALQQKLFKLRTLARKPDDPMIKATQQKLRALQETMRTPQPEPSDMVQAKSAKLEDLRQKSNKLRALARDQDDPAFKAVREEMRALKDGTPTPQPESPTVLRGQVFRSEAPGTSQPALESRTMPAPQPTPALSEDHPSVPPLPTPVITPLPPTAPAQPVPALPPLPDPARRPAFSVPLPTPSVDPVLPPPALPGVARPSQPEPAGVDEPPLVGGGGVVAQEAVGTAVLQVTLAPDGKTFATACDDGVVRIYDVASRKVVRELKDVRTVTTMNQETTVEGNQVLRPVVSTINPPRLWAVAYRPDGNTLVSAGGDFMDHEHPSPITVWDVPSGKIKARLKGHEHTILALAISPNGRWLVSGGFDNFIHIWDLATNTSVEAVVGHVNQGIRVAHPVRTIAWNPDGETFAWGEFDGTLNVWSKDRKAIETVKFPENLNSVVYARDGKTIVVGGGTQAHVLIWKDGKSHEIKTFQFQRSMLAVAISPDGKSVAAGGGNLDNLLELRTWDIDSALETRSLSEPGEWIESLVYTSDGKTLIAGGGISHKPGFVTLWDLSGMPEAPAATVRPLGTPVR